MKGRSTCEQCKKEFDWVRYKNQTVARFCSKSCWYKKNGKKLASFNDERFQWNKASEEEKLEKLKMNYEKHVVRKDGCWGWLGPVDKNGYGQLPCGYQKLIKAHRVSWRIYKGDIPEKHVICHSCDNPPCTNPDHLFIGTKKDNAQDMMKKGRSTRGERNYNAKLTEEDVKNIKFLLSLGVTGTRISKDFKISESVIHGIKKGIYWRHISDD